ncbi:MAG: methyltransferase domain-containing protein [Deltaproteobacteria bacterium]|nr:methyltransferase domain-containing protein [Deltaproteobacteria bacterium]
MSHKFNPEHIERLLRQERHTELSPEKVLREAGLAENMVFADIGCGPGFFTLPAAKIVGMHGIVFAVDTQTEMLLYLRDKMDPPQNIVLLKSDEDNIPIGDYEADLALLAFMLHETEDKVKFLKEVFRILNPGGTLLIVDWKKQKEEHGPPEEERLTEAQVTELLKEAGFKDFEQASLNNSHYKIIASKG